jgi:hypothetical protein
MKAFMTDSVVRLITEQFTKWRSAEDAFKFWAERIKLFMDPRAVGEDPQSACGFAPV